MPCSRRCSRCWWWCCSRSPSAAKRARWSQVASSVLWLAVLLAGLLALDTLFRGDAEDGSLEQWMLAPVPLSWLVLVRTFMHWATTALPLLLATPLLGELLHLPRSELPVLMASLALGTPLLSLLGAVVAALTVGMRRSGILVALLALPLYVPVLVFGAGSVAAAAQGLDPIGALLLLGAGPGAGAGAGTARRRRCDPHRP